MQAATHNTGVRRLLAILGCSLVITFLLQHYVFAVYIIEGTSMSPALHDGDTALVNMLPRTFGRPERGEIVLVRDGSVGFATKRIVGLPGETVEFHNASVYLNGRPLTEPYLPKDALTVSRQSSYVLGPDQYFVLGDHRSDSFDSRSYGPVSRGAIMGSYTRTFWACR